MNPQEMKRIGRSCSNEMSEPGISRRLASVSELREFQLSLSSARIAGPVEELDVESLDD